MIFKTFDSDIDKISAKWGVFGKSFYDFAEASRNRKIAIDDLFTLDGVPLKDAKKQAGSFWSYLYPKKEDIQKQLIDVDSIIPKIDSDNFDFDNWINELNEVDKKVKAGTISWQDYSNSLDNNQKWIAKWGEETQGTIRTQEGLIKANEGARQSAIAHNAALKQQTLGAKAASVAMNLLSTAANMLVMYAISKLITAWDDYKEKLREVAQETAEQAEKSSNNAQSLLDLQEKLDDNTVSAEDLTTAFREQMRTMGYTEEEIDNLIDKYNGLAGAIKGATEEALNNAKTDAYADMSTSGRSLTVEAKGNTNVGTYYSQNKELSEEIRKMLDESTAILDGGIYRMDKNASAEDIYSYYLTLKDISQLIQETAKETDDDSLLAGDSMNPTPYYQVSEALDALSESAELYGDAVSRLHNADAQLELSNYLKTNDIDSKEAFDSYVNGIKNNTTYSEAYKQVLLEVANDAFPHFSAAAKDASSSLDELKSKYQEAVDKRKELYSGSNYVGNVDINNRPVVVNDDGTYSTTSTSFQERQLDDGSYEIIHFTPILPDGTILKGNALNDYLDKILSSSDVLSADNPANGGYGLVYKVDTEVNGQKITDGNLDEAFGVADAWDVEMHNLQDKMYRDEAELKIAIKEFGQNGNEITVSNIFELEDADGTLTTLGKISESIDTIQNAYKTLSSAIDEYNETGSFSIDTLQSVIALGDNWLDYLVDEEGKLKLDKEALQQLTASRLEDMKMQAINNIIDNVSKIQTDADATLYLASTNYALAESYKDVAENAIETAKAQMELAVVAGTLSQENYEASASKMDADIEKVYKLFDNTDFISDISLGGGSGSKSKSDFKETVDFFERRIDILNDAISRLKSNLEIVTGSFAKNNLIDAQSSIYQEELRNYTDALAMYQKKANEVLSNLPDDIAEKVKNGAIDLTTFVGASSEAVVDAINEYEQWAEKVDDCNLQLIELQKTLSDLELEKFNNVVSDFSSQFDLRDNVITNIDKHIALLEEQGQLIGASFYDAQIQQSQKQLNLLEQEKIQLVEQMNSALASGNVKTGSETWLEMVGVLSDVEGQITDCKKSIEEFSNEILELNWKSFEHVQNTFSDLNTELENFVGLLDDIDVADDKGNWSTEAKTKLGLLSQQYELAVYQVGEYKSAIEELKKQYANGDYSAIEFSEKLAELSDGMWDATNSANDLRNAIVDLNEQRVEVQIEGIEKEISAYEELVDEQIKLIEETDNLIKKRDDLAEKSKSVTDLERQIASMMHDDSQATVAKRLKLEEELAEARKDLADTEREYSVDSQKTALEKQLEEYTNERNAEIETLEKSLENKEQLIADSFETVKQNASTIGQQIAQIATEHGVIVSDSLISSWAQGENAIASYGTVLSSQSSAFIGNIMDVESKVWDLQSQANNTSTSLAGMFSTQADNLVNELSQSYYAEGNVLNMTNALHDSLINTLESGYDVSKITSALQSIEDSARGAIDEINKLKEEENSANSRPVYAVVDRATGKTVATYNDIDEADAFIKSAKFADRNLLKPRELYVERYASGTRSSKGNIIITDEEGQELKLPKLSSGKYTIANEGTQILTKVQTDNIFDWSKINPDALIPQFTKNVFNDIPKVATRNVSQPVTIENKVIFTGAVNDANNFAKQIAQITDKQITKSWKEFTSELHR